MFTNILKRPLTLAFIPLLLAWGVISLLIPPGLYNDDFQIYFQYCNGGEGSIPFSFYSGVLEGFLLIGLNSLAPSLNWYLIFLHIVGSAACLGLNLFTTTRCATANFTKYEITRLLSALAILSYINFQCIYFSQYTHTGILCSCVSLFLLYNWWQGIGSNKQLAASIGLFICSYELRDQSITPFLVLGAGVLIAAILNHHQHPVSRRKIWVIAVYPLLLFTLFATDKLTFASAESWSETYAFNKIRMGIQDARDNSGINKSAALNQASVDPEAFKLFQPFTYYPEFCDESSQKLAIVRDIHQSQRKGFMGSELAASLGILSQEGYTFKGGATLLRAITPWIPLLIGLMIILPAANRQSIYHALPMILALLAYFGILLLLQRAVGRVLHPVLYAGGIWLITSPITDRRLTASPLIYISGALMAVLMTLFCFREARWFFTPKALTWEYCAQHPQNLYLTTSMQGLNLYPTGYHGVSLQYFAKTNIVPIADGWCFYSPAYKAALKTRNISNPYTEILKENTYIVTQNNIDEEGALNLVSAIHKKQIGTGLKFSKIESVGSFSFWKAVATP